MIPSEIEEKVMSMVDEKVNEVFAHFQERLGIESGDISPIQLLGLEKREKSLVDEIMCVLTSQYNNDGESIIHFITINCDGEQRDWHMTPTELMEEFNSVECNLPMNDDTVLTCRYGGTQMYFETFGELNQVFLGTR